MKYSMLIVAIDCHFSHMARFVNNLKLANPNIEIHFFTNKKKEDLPDEIINNVDEIIYQKQTDFYSRYGLIKMYYSLRKQFKELSKNNSYDIVDIHFPRYFLALIMPYLHKMSKNVVVTPWGSDILRVEGRKLKILMNGVLNKCDYITTTENGNVGKRILSFLPDSRGKFRPMAWGSETIDYINTHFSEIDTQTAKKRFGLADRYVITCAYNAFPAQNHEKIIEAVAQIRTQLPDNLSLLFPVSYGFTDKDEYVAKLRDNCKEKHLDALFIEDYLSVKDVFYLRMATDLFVHVQNTDAGCSSLQEYLLCNKKVIHGNWIHYPMLEAYPPLCYYPATNFSSLGNAILKAYQSDGIKVAEGVLEYIRHNGWEERRKEWNDFFSSLVK